MKNPTRFVVIGAGNGGQSLAGDLAERGFQVAALYDRYPQAIEAVQKRGGVELVGPVRSGFGKVDLITADIGEAVRAGDVIFIVVPAFAHAWIAEQMAPHIQEGQTVMVLTGYLGGSLLFRKIFQEQNTSNSVTFAETESLPYATRLVGPAKAGIKAIKQKLLMSALPATKTDDVLNLLKPALPALIPGDDVLTVGLCNRNPIAHVPTYILNLGRVSDDMPSGHFDWHDWVTPDIVRVQNVLEAERQQVCEALGVRFFSSETLEAMHYEGKPWAIIQPEGEMPQNAQTIPDRFITEDVPMGFVPLASLGQTLGVETPVHHSLITIASTYKTQDYWQQGRTMESLGLAGLNPQEIKALIR